jgi:hypothetical protein
MSDSLQHDQEEPSKLVWNHELDRLLAGWCDQAKCFEWMHNESYTACDKSAKTYMVAINCISAISGVSNIIVGGYTWNGFQLAWIFGGLSILGSTLNILQDKLGFSQNGLVHKKLASSWSVLISKLEELLILPYSARQDCKACLKFIKADINQAKLEGASLLPPEIRKACYERFGKIQNFDIPDICGQIEHTRIAVGSEGSCSDLQKLLITNAPIGNTVTKN